MRFKVKTMKVINKNIPNQKNNITKRKIVIFNSKITLIMPNNNTKY